MASTRSIVRVLASVATASLVLVGSLQLRSPVRTDAALALDLPLLQWLLQAFAASAPAAPTPTTLAPSTTTTAPLAVPQVKPLPVSRILFDSNRSGNYEVFMIDRDGSGTQQLTNDRRFDSWWPKLSPDRTLLIFYRTPAGTHDLDYAKASLWSLNLQTKVPTLLLAAGAYGWKMHGHAEWSPDGSRLTMFGGPESPEIFVTDTLGANPVQVTRRGGPNLDPSWSPDGRSLVFVGCPQSFCGFSQLEVYRTPVAGGSETRLTFDGLRDHDPYYSPDGRTIAWLRETSAPMRWGILAMVADGSAQRTVIDDGGINSKPGWSPDSGTIFFHRLPIGGQSFGLYSIRPNGTGLARIPGSVPGGYNDEYPVNSSY